MSEDVLLEGGRVFFRPSYSATWINCAGSLLPSIEAKDTAGYEAAEGTVFHELIAEWQQNGRPDFWLGQTRTVTNQHKDGTQDIFEVVVGEEMFVNAEECLRRVADYEGDRFVETRVDISSITPIPGQSGTCDLAVCQVGILDVTDWKYGKGIKVFAFQNTQLLLYVIGFFEEFDRTYGFQTIRIRIAQPRLDHWDLWEITRSDLVAFKEFVRGRAALAWTPGAPRTPSPKACQWCKVRVDCVAREAALQALADDSFSILEPLTMSQQAQQALVVSEPVDYRLSDPVGLPTSRLAWIYTFRKDFEIWFREIGEELIRRGFNGDHLGGLWKVARGRPGHRHWVDEGAAAAALMKLGLTEDEIYERRLISPNEAEKRLRTVGVRGKLGKGYVNLHTDRAIGRPTLVPIGDNRSNVAEIVDDSFEIIEEPVDL